MQYWPRLRGERRSKVSPHPIDLLSCSLMALREQIGDVGLGDDSKSQARRFCRRQVDYARRQWLSSTGKNVPSTRAELQAFLLSVMDDEEIASWPRTKKTGQLSTSSDALEKAIHIPGITQLLNIRHLEKLINTFGDSLAEWVDPETGRIHPNYNVAATKSGRWTCTRPNLQQIPSDRLSRGFRKIFTAPFGRSMIGADYSQMELRAAAEISEDPELRKIYENGEDLHRIMAALMAKVPENSVTAEQRSRAKPVNFGAIYGMGARGLVKAAWSGYRFEMSNNDASRYLSSFFQKFRRLKLWMQEHSKICQRRRRLAIASGRVLEAAWEAPGDIRYTQSCNLPIQGACAGKFPARFSWHRYTTS